MGCFLDFCPSWLPLAFSFVPVFAAWVPNDVGCDSKDRAIIETTIWAKNVRGI